MFVTAFYDLYHNQTKQAEYLELFLPIVESGIHIILFTDQEINWNYPNLTIIYLQLNECELYQIAMNYNGPLPDSRNIQKDTKEFLALMNTKIEFLKRAKETNSCSNYFWIDMGILKIVKDRESVLKQLQHIHLQSIMNPYQTISIPGCWDFGIAMNPNQIHWRFCGGFMLIPNDKITVFYEHVKNVLRDCCTNPIYKLTWETNVWAVVEMFSGENIKWFKADHDDSIFYITS